MAGRDIETDRDSGPLLAVISFPCIDGGLLFGAGFNFTI